VVQFDVRQALACRSTGDKLKFVGHFTPNCTTTLRLATDSCRGGRTRMFQERRYTSHHCMKGLFARLFAAFTAFTVGYGGHIVTGTRSGSASVIRQGTELAAQAFSIHLETGGARGIEKRENRHVSQEALVRLPTIGRVRVQAFEPLGDGAEFLFADATSGKEILSTYFSDNGVNDESKTRFKTISVKHPAGPLIFTIGMNPGGSDSAWEASIVGVVGGKLEELTYEHLKTSDEGGFFVGDLGHGVGFGVAQWDFVWGEDEAHVSPHQYEITLYKWNGRRFEWFRVFRTRARYTSGQAALRANGLNYTDIRKTFPDWSDVENGEQLIRQPPPWPH